MKLLWRVALTLGLCAFLWPSFSLAGTSDVFRVQTTLNGTVQRGAFNNGIISKVIISADDLVNLAQRRPLGTPVPSSEILALTSDCSTNDPQLTRLIVFDSAGGTNLVTIGTLSNLTAAAYTKRHYVETITQITVADISTADTNGVLSGITGGSFYYHAKINITTNGCPTSFGGQLTGFLGTAFPSSCSSNFCTNVISAVLTNCITNMVVNCETNSVTNADCRTVISFPCTDAISVIIPRSPMTTGKSIGTLAE